MPMGPGRFIRWFCISTLLNSFDATRSYHRIEEKVDHATALKRCADLGMTLGILESATSLALMKAVVPAGAWKEYWIGLDSLSGKFKWADNSASTWSQWKPGEPNYPNTQRCVITNTDAGYTWYSRACDEQYYIICSVDLVTEYFTEVFHAAPANDPVASFPVVNRMYCVASCRRDPDCYFVTVEVSAGVCTCGTYNFSTFQAGLTSSSRDSWIPVNL